MQKFTLKNLVEALGKNEEDVRKVVATWVESKLEQVGDGSSQPKGVISGQFVKFKVTKDVGPFKKDDEVALSSTFLTGDNKRIFALWQKLSHAKCNGGNGVKSTGGSKLNYETMLAVKNELAQLGVELASWKALEDLFPKPAPTMKKVTDEEYEAFMAWKAAQSA